MALKHSSSLRGYLNSDFETLAEASIESFQDWYSHIQFWERFGEPQSTILSIIHTYLLSSRQKELVSDHPINIAKHKAMRNLRTRSVSEDPGPSALFRRIRSEITMVSAS
ncbi:hypothetical protein BDR22DRAFT_718424 [Usnea florida]